jgi:ABC-type dipeptide/oligopeptide/nickel transport system permease component
MLTFVARRLLLAVPVLLGVVFAVMLTVELIPGDAVALMLGEHATPEAVARLRDYLGLDKPILVRYAAYVAGWRTATSAAPSSRTAPSSTSWPARGRPPSS